jgi:hypothetical protein
MLQSGEVVDADVVGDRNVLLSIRAGVDQGGDPSPLFIGRVGEKDFGRHFVSDRLVE